MVVGILYTSDVSQPCRAVQLLGKALGIQLEYIETSLIARDQLKPEYLKLNPQHTIPMYIDQDGTVIWDSHAIMAYLVGKYGKDDALYPKDLAKRAVVDQRLHFDTGSVFALLRSMTLPIYQNRVKGISAVQIDVVKDSYEFLNAFLEGHPWMAGNEMTIADLSLISSITSICYVVPIDSKYGNLLAWIKRCEQLPYYAEVNEKGLELIKTFYEELLNKA